MISDNNVKILLDHFQIFSHLFTEDKIEISSNIYVHLYQYIQSSSEPFTEYRVRRIASDKL